MYRKNKQGEMELVPDQSDKRNSQNTLSRPLITKSKNQLQNFIAKNLFLMMIVLAAFFGVGFIVGKNHQASILATGLQDVEVKNHGGGERVDFSLFWDSWDVLGEMYVDQENLDPQTLLYGAIKGMFAATGDPYTTFFDPEVNKAFNEDLSGSFEGIGAEIGIRDTFLTIVAPLDGSPAEKSGLRAGDRIIEIDGEVSADLSTEDAVKRIRGDKGTDVILTIYREGENDTRDIAVTRDTIILESVKLTEREDGIAYIRVAQFGNDTAKDFKAILEKIKNNNTKQVIIDLRNNPGGVLGGAAQMIGYIVPRNSTVVIEQFATGEQEPMKTRFNPILANDVQFVVLINQGSASASEIMAGAMSELITERVTLVGQKSFGKGSVQQLVPMDGGTAAKITIAKWLTPNGVQIDDEGIEPKLDIEISEDDFLNDRDPQLDAAAELLKGASMEDLKNKFESKGADDIQSTQDGDVTDEKDEVNDSKEESDGEEDVK